MICFAGKLTTDRRITTESQRRWARLFANIEATEMLLDAIKRRVDRNGGVKNHRVETASTPRFLDHSAKKVT